ncbi:MAG: dockerin type I repeat-containing protein [Planctomycetota bacterium]
MHRSVCRLHGSSRALGGGRLWLFLVGLLLASPAMAQDYTITAENESGFNGDIVAVSILMNNLQPIRGFSLGLTHDASVVTLSTIAEGALSAAAHSGAGADFVHSDTSAAGGPGGVLGVLVSTNTPIEELPAGVNQEIGLFTYTIVGAPGDTTALTFSGSLGSPAVPLVYSVAGVSNTPVATAGSIDVLTPAVENLACTLIDPCTCETSVTWTNPIVYSVVSVFVNGSLATTTTGTSATLTLPSAMISDICVVGTSGGEDSAQVCCMVDCPAIAPTLPVTNLMCDVDESCLATLSWTNAGTYTGIDILVDGVLDHSLAGGVAATTLTLPSFATFNVCVVPIGDCNMAATAACCMLECVEPPMFSRGDANGDGAIDISDAVITLAYLFLGEINTCIKALDVNDDGMANLLDPVFSLDYQFNQGTVPSAPFMVCGVDPTTDTLTCDSFPLCP